MSIAYSDIKSEVLKNLDLSSTDTEAEDKFQILLSVNAAQRSILRKVPVEQIDNILSTALGALQQDIAYYAWPSDFIRFSKAWVSYSEEIDEDYLGIPITKMEHGNFVVNNLDKAPSTQNPKLYYIDGGFELRPKPTADQTNGYMIRYVYQPAAISATQPSLLRDDLYNALIFRTTQLAAMKGGNRAAHAEKYGGLFATEISGIWSDYKKRDE